MPDGSPPPPWNAMTSGTAARPSYDAGTWIRYVRATPPDSIVPEASSVDAKDIAGEQIATTRVASATVNLICIFFRVELGAAREAREKEVRLAASAYPVLALSCADC